jgi:hypothetical protein
MPRNDQIYNSVMASPLMTQPMQQVYWALWPYEQGLTKGEVTAALRNVGTVMDEKNPWEKQLPLMVKMGIIKRGNKRHCTAKNKEEVVWLLTDVATPLKPKSNKPSAAVYKRAVAQLESVIAHHDQHGDGFITPDLRKLYEWVRDKVE